MTRRRLAGVGAGLLAVLLLVAVGGWGQDARYEHRIQDFRSTVWELQAAVTAGVTPNEYRVLLRESRAAQLAARARLSQRDARRPSWDQLNEALWAFEQSSLREAESALHRADRLRHAWWWKDLPRSLDEVWAKPDNLKEGP